MIDKNLSQIFLKIIVLFISSGHGDSLSKVLKPASTWAIFIFFNLAVIAADIDVIVSPWTTTKSGFSMSKI